MEKTRTDEDQNKQILFIAQATAQIKRFCKRKTRIETQLKHYNVCQFVFVIASFISGATLIISAFIQLHTIVLFK